MHVFPQKNLQLKKRFRVCIILHMKYRFYAVKIEVSFFIISYLNGYCKWHRFNSTSKWIYLAFFIFIQDKITLFSFCCCHPNTNIIHCYFPFNDAHGKVDVIMSPSHVLGFIKNFPVVQYFILASYVILCIPGQRLENIHNHNYY